MRAKLIIVACITFCTPLLAQDAICPADYYPIAVGIEREYQGNDSTTTETVDRIEGGLFVIVDDTGIETYWSSDDQGMKVHKFYLPDQEPELQWSFFDPPITRYPYNMEIGVEYEDRALLDIPGISDLTTNVQFDSTFEGIEDHTVGDRTYPLCAKITTRDASRSVFLSQVIVTAVTDSTEWWAWGIGPVERQSHIVTWDIINGTSEEWITAKLIRCTLLEDDPPDLQIVQPTTHPVYGTDTSTIDVSCTASDDSRVMKLTWQDDQGHSGQGTLDGDWRLTAIPLVEGENPITLTAWDSCGNTSTAVLTVYRISFASLSPQACHEGESLQAIQLTGSGFPADVLIELTHDDETVVATNVQVSGGGTSVEFDLDLQSCGAQSWDLIIKHPSHVELATLPGGFQTLPLTVTDVDRTLDSAIAISWTTCPARSYQVWVAPAPDGEWELAATISSQGQATSWQDAPPQEMSRRFYRFSPVPF